MLTLYRHLKLRIKNRNIWLSMLIGACLLTGAGGSSAAGIGESVPTKCQTTDVDYYIDNIVPSGICGLPTDTIQIDFDVFIWGNPTRYNFTTGYSRANDSILQDIECLSTGIDIDGAGCDDYNGIGSQASPFVTSSFFDVACDLDNNGAVDPVLAIDLFVSMSTKSGDTGLEINSPKCKIQTGNTIPLLPAELTLDKIVVNDNNGVASITDWVLNANIGGDAAELSGVSGVTSNQLAAGDYVLSETGPAGYTMTGLSCDSGVFDSATNTLTLAPGDVVNCSFTNDDDIPITTLTLSKLVVNDQGGALGINDFSLLINGSPVTSGVANVVPHDTDLLISEVDNPAYLEGSWNCSDTSGLTTGLPTNGDAFGTLLNLSEGSTVACSITNNDQPADIRLTKQVSNTSVQPGSVVTYQVTVENVGTAEARNILVTDILSTYLTYLENSINGGDATDDSDPDGSGLSWSIGTMAPGTTTTLSFQATVGTP